ncbi:hypothetical protein [Vitreimonas flagellata]|uniref:hypothetical protein n=1 Tax=Vitreimonas flagellata TaxID=2560861 RepID=UPI001074AFCC|nr:hypothetical protein [Vitreimonas flagellata]
MRAFLISALLLVGCASAPAAEPPAANLPQHIREDLAQRDAALAEAGVVVARINESANLGDGLVVRPFAVLEDSRCPQNARCVWAGRLRLNLVVEGVGEREIILGEEAVQTPRGAFELVAVSPGPWTDWPEGAMPAYRFGFKRA